MDYQQLSRKIKKWASDLGFQQSAVTDTHLYAAEQNLINWLDRGLHADMSYMSKHGLKRSRPQLLEPNTFRIISFRMNYYPEDYQNANIILNRQDKAYISRYALGRDYHKLIRQRLKKLVSRIHQELAEMTTAHQFRIYVDSAPVMEKSIADKAGLGWIGKHSNLVNQNNGSWFFLAEIYTDMPLPADQIEYSRNHCGSCQKCIDKCPTGAIIEPYIVDSAKCISYLTIENKGAIPIKYRQAMGNRIYGCDDCQIVCPWNKFSTLTSEQDFYPRHQLDNITLLHLFNWTEAQFLSYFEGSPIRRIGYTAWLRNLAVALGNYLRLHPYDKKVIQALKKRIILVNNPMLEEHISWALQQSIT